MAAVEGDRLTPETRYMKALAEAGYSNFMVLDREGAEEILTERRMESLETISEKSPGSVSELADFVDRKIPAVSRDLKTLHRNRLIRFEEGPAGGKKPVLDQEYIFVEPLMEPVD